ncbi:MAG: glutaminyl-peptide cyclotransferase [Undibacterium sp.]|nr:glutaminyl-peptide cyclotransferase [Opitutaceae bacterium]
MALVASPPPTLRLSGAVFLPALLALLVGCGGKPPATATPGVSTPPPAALPSAPVANTAAAPVPEYTYQVVSTFPHDPAAFTQGLVYLKGVLFETTGLNGRSSLRRVEYQTGRVLQKSDLPSQYFGEGMTIIGDRIFQITWQNQKGFVYNLASFAVEKEFTYAGEGWGLTTDGQALILSDGTHTLRFLDPTTFTVLRTISVFDRGRPLRRLNELEYVKGEIYANVWQTNTVVRIDPTSGQLLGTVDFSGLLSPDDYRHHPDVLNGIAYEASGDRLFITGKLWPKLFEVRLKPL